MAKKLLGPWKALYPVRFYSGGDTTSQAFGKHIQEIERIYGLLNALDAGKAGSADIADALQKHIDSANPHPNWKPKLSFSDIAGNIDAKRIYGDLVNAYIDASHVKNLQALVKGLIPPPTPTQDKGDGIVAASLGDNGYIKFRNSLLIQWGTGKLIAKVEETKVYAESFPVAFPSYCYNVVQGSQIMGSNTESELIFHLMGYGRTGIMYRLHKAHGGSSMKGAKIHFVAFGV